MPGKHPLHFKRNSGERDEGFPVFLEPHYRGRAHLIYKYVCGGWDDSLSCCGLVELESATFHYSSDGLEHALVFHRLASEYFHQHGFGDVVFSRAETSRSDYDVRSFESLLYCPTDIFGIVVDHSH